MEKIDLASSAARTTSGNGSTAVVYGKLAVAYIDCSAASGTAPTLDVTLQARSPNGGDWFPIGTFAQLTGVGQERVVISELPDMEVRASWAIAGTTPSFTFSVVLVAK